LRIRKAKAKVTPNVKAKRETSAKGQSRAKARKRLKGKENKPAEKSGKKNKVISRDPVDIARVRTDILNMVGNSAIAIASEVINAALAGELARAKYLFEIAGVYPAREETGATNPEESSLAHILLKRMGLPTDPVSVDEDSESAGEKQNEGTETVRKDEGDNVE
jgi:hypothetical protein